MAIKPVVVDNKQRTSRQLIADPLLDVAHRRRLVLAKAIDLRNNSRSADAGSGYVEILPLDCQQVFADDT